MKKFLAVILAVSLILSLSIVAFAADAEGDTLSYFELARAADDIAPFTFTDEVNNITVTEKSDRIFLKKDGVYYVYYFPEIMSISNKDKCATVHMSVSYKYENFKFVPYKQEMPSLGSSPTSVGTHIWLADVCYSEKEYADGSLKIENNVSGLKRTLSGSVSNRDLSGIWQTIKPLIPLLLPAIVLFLAFRKGWSFLKGETASA